MYEKASIIKSMSSTLSKSVIKLSHDKISLKGLKVEQGETSHTPPLRIRHTSKVFNLCNK